MPIVEVKQQTPEWLAMRIGMVTGSRVFEITDRKVPTKVQKDLGQPGDYKKSRADYLTEVVVERLTGRAVEHFVTQAMEEGIENEPLAKAAYEMKTGFEVQDGGFAIHPKLEWFGASPDGLVGDDGLIEIKCPKSTTHLETIASGEIPEEYLPQMMAEMACAERQWVDFVSFDPRMPKSLQLWVKRFHRDEKCIGILEEEVKKFLDEVVFKLAELAEFAAKESDAVPEPF